MTTQPPQGTLPPGSQVPLQAGSPQRGGRKACWLGCVGSGQQKQTDRQLGTRWHRGCASGHGPSGAPVRHRGDNLCGSGQRASHVWHRPPISWGEEILLSPRPAKRPPSAFIALSMLQTGRLGWPSQVMEPRDRTVTQQSRAGTTQRPWQQALGF